MAPTQQDDEITGIHVTPLVDITLVLLIVFMVTAKLMVSQALPMDLPKAASAGEAQSMLTFVIEADGRTRANDTVLVDDAALASFVAREHARDRDVRAVISASSRADHGHVMRVLDALRSQGISKVAFGAEKVP